MIKIRFWDMYGGVTSVFIHGAANQEKLKRVHDAIESFLEVAGDVISDDNSNQVGRKFARFSRTVGFPVTFDSPVESVGRFEIDLTSGNVLIDQGMDDDSEALTLPKRIPERMHLDEDYINDIDDEERAVQEYGIPDHVEENVRRLGYTYPDYDIGERRPVRMLT